MNAKKLLTLLLLAFVGISIVYLVVDRSRSSPAAESETIAAADEQPRLVKAYYFHATKRCPTCLEIERLADETITTEFRNELDAGVMTWEIINYESPGNEHFVDDYDLMYSSLVLVLYENGRETAWVNLEKVWDLVWEPGAYSAYVAEETQAFLNGADSITTDSQAKLR
jgi:hypothetical protein